MSFYIVLIHISIALLIVSCTSFNKKYEKSVQSPKMHSIEEFDPNPDSLNAICRTTDCRNFIRLKLTLPDKSVIDDTVLVRMPYIYEDRIILFSGEKIDVLLTEKNGKVHVEKTDTNNATLSISFTQEDKFMMLNLRNHGKRDIKYHCLMRVSPKPYYYETSSCPVWAEKSAFETWPHPIVQLLLHDIRFVKNYTMCEY